MHRSDIQVIRGLSVIAVIFYHANPNVFKFGYLGVDIFFVISGFVILPTLIKSIIQHDSNKFQLLEFYKRRFFRLYPALIFTLIVSLIMLYLLYPPEYHSRISRQGLASLFFMGNFGALIYSGDYFALNPNPLVHLWSLAVEAQIYIVLPLLLIILYKFRIKIQISLIFFTILSLIFFSFPFLSENIVAWFGYQNEEQASFYLSFDRFWQFSVGGLCGVLQFKRLEKIFESDLRYFLFLSVNLFLVCIASNNQKIGSVFATLLAVIVILGKRFTHKRYWRLIWIGDRSYSLYLIHMPVFAITNYSPVIEPVSQINFYLPFLVGLSVTLLLANLSYHFFEQKYRYRTSSITSSKHKYLTVSTYFFACLSFFVLFTQTADRDLENFYKKMKIEKDAWALDQNCDRMSNTDVPCFYNSGSSKGTVLLIGDSHAAQYSQALIEIGIQQDFEIVIWTQASCPFILYKSAYPNTPSKCIENNNKKLKWVAEHNPEYLIISYFYQIDYNSLGLLDGVNSLAQNVKRVIFIENTPIFPDKSKFLQPLPKIMKPYSNPKSFKFNEMDLSRHFSAETFYSKLKMEGILTIDISPKICQNNVCTRYRDGRWLYADDNHLSVKGAQLIKSFLIEELS